MISLRHVSRTFQLKDRVVEAVKDISLEVAKGEYVIISGRSGNLIKTRGGIRAGRLPDAFFQPVYFVLRAFQASRPVFTHIF